MTEIRDFGDGVHLALYTEDEMVRRAVRKLPAFQYEQFYHVGSPTGPLVGVDLVLSVNGSRSALWSQLEGVIKSDTD